MTISKHKAREKAMAMCSRSEKCSIDISKALERWGITEQSAIDDIIRYLKKNKFIDHRRYSISFARDKAGFNKWGKLKISNMLLSKGIEEYLVDEAMDEIDENSYLSMVKDELKKKRKSLKAVNTFELKGKLMRFASSRGYEPHIVYSLFEDMFSD